MMLQAQLQAGWLELPSSLQVLPLLPSHLPKSQPLELLVLEEQKSLPSEVILEASLAVSLGLQSLLLVVSELHPLEGEATVCCLHIQAFRQVEPHWVAEASPSLGKMLLQWARPRNRFR